MSAREFFAVIVKNHIVYFYALRLKAKFLWGDVLCHCVVISVTTRVGLVS